MPVWTVSDETSGTTDKMEKDLQKCIDDLMAVPDVVGVLCADSNGLCLTAQGTARSNSSGSLMALSRLAASIEPGTEDPVLLFDGPDRQCAVRRNAGVTLAIYKEKGQRAEPPQ